MNVIGGFALECELEVKREVPKRRRREILFVTACVAVADRCFWVDARVRSQLALSWGVETFLVPSVHHTDDMVAQVDFSLLSIGRLKVGDRVVVVAGSPPNTVGSTNLIRVHEVGTDS